MEVLRLIWSCKSDSRLAIKFQKIINYTVINYSLSNVGTNRWHSADRES